MELLFIWGIGHNFTLIVFGLSVIRLKQEIPDPVAMSLEFIVGVASFIWEYQMY